MKKYVCFLLLFFLFIIDVNAIDIELNNKIIEFDQVDGFELQGFTNTDKYLFMVLTNNDDSKSNIKVFDLNSYQLIYDNYDYNLGHSNDVTYNSKSNIIYVANSSGSDIINAFNGDDFSYLESFHIDLPIRSMTYIDDLDKYAVRMVTTGYILENDFKKNSNIPFIYNLNISKEVGRQGWTYYDNFIYYCNWSWIRMGGDGSNTIQIFDLDGKYIDKYKTNTTVGEIEGISFYNNKMILGFNEYEGRVAFYLEDVIPVEMPSIQEEIHEEIEKLDKMNYLHLIVIGFVFIIVIIVSIIIIKKRF